MSDGRTHPFHLRYQRFEREGPLARAVRAESQIEARREEVWATLVDFERYGEWNPFTRAVHTTLEVGDPVELHVDMPGRSTSVRTEWVNLVEPGRTICWGMHMGHPALLCANRWQSLHDLPGGATRYETVDYFSGVLTPMVIALYGEPTRLGFASVAVALKQRVESRARAMEATA